MVLLDHFYSQTWLVLIVFVLDYISHPFEWCMGVVEPCCLCLTPFYVSVYGQITSIQCCPFIINYLCRVVHVGLTLFRHDIYPTPCLLLNFLIFKKWLCLGDVCVCFRLEYSHCAVVTRRNIFSSRGVHLSCKSLAS